MPIMVLALNRHTLLQNVVYALPSISTTMFCDTGAAVFEKATKSDFVLNSSVNLTDGRATLPGNAFIRCTSGSVPITLSRS